MPANELLKHTSNTKLISKDGEPKIFFVEWNPTIECEYAHNAHYAGIRKNAY